MLDAAGGRLWVHEPVAGDGIGPRYQSQGRWLEQAARLVGLAAELTGSVAERIVAELGLVGGEHAVARRRYAASRRLVDRGAVVVAVLDELRLTDDLLSRVLAAGEVAGLWGRPWLCDDSTGQRYAPGSSAGRWRRGPPQVRS